MAVKAQRDDAVVSGEGSLCAVPVVAVDIQHEDTAKCVAQRKCREHHIVDVAKPARSCACSMVAPACKVEGTCRAVDKSLCGCEASTSNYTGIEPQASPCRTIVTQAKRFLHLRGCRVSMKGSCVQAA